MDGSPQMKQPHWTARAAFPLISLVLLLAQSALGFVVYQAWYWLAVPLVLVVGHLMHGQLIGFHEASHGMLRKNRRLNEIDGVIIGLFSFMSFSLYRASHQTHHMHLGTERDEELWPFVRTDISRPARIFAAIMELTMGLLFTPFLFMRTFFRRDSPIRAKKVRRRIWAELILMVTVWTTVLIIVAYTGAWKYLLWMFLIPGWLAGNMQSVRKYIEHVGLYGSTPNGSTRSIVAKGWAGKLVSFTLLHEPYHGVHHQHAGVPHAELPNYEASLMPKSPDEQAPFPSYWRAFLHLFRSLGDPRVGAHWRTVPPHDS
jgi:fatty acid desaturase